MKLFLFLVGLVLLIPVGVFLTAAMDFWWVPVLAVGLVWQVQWLKTQRPRVPPTVPPKR